MLNKSQIKLVQYAVRAAGLRGKGFEGRYRLLLAKYRQKSGQPVTSCKQLNNYQLDDLLAICESMGWRHPGHAEDFYRLRAALVDIGRASYAQIAAIEHLAGDLGWTPENLKGMLLRMTGQRTDSLSSLSSEEAWVIIEAMKNMVIRTGVTGKTLADVTDHYREVNERSQGWPSQTESSQLLPF